MNTLRVTHVEITGDDATLRAALDDLRALLAPTSTPRTPPSTPSTPTATPPPPSPMSTVHSPLPAVASPRPASNAHEEADVLRHLLAVLPNVGDSSPVVTIFSMGAGRVMARRVARLDRRFSYSGHDRGVPGAGCTIRRIQP
ncbi:MAG: hypothetical protein BroJett004_08250 [Planctomycetota bacterium]|nr:MAG: hypothetical protein BroJett004_08250 [Planctomycetota bacterium]